MVDTYFLGDTESAVPSAFSISEIDDMCAVGTHAVGALTELCPGFDDGNYVVNNWFSATDYVGAFSPGSDAENNWAAAVSYTHLTLPTISDV